MVDLRIKPYSQLAAEAQRRTRQLAVYRRNQALGLLLIAAALCLWRLCHTLPAWIFPPGWWRP